jgi:class 3 adenylate cyclase
MDQAIPPLCAVLFADVAGSTGLYERLGDRQAKDLISQALDMAVALVQQHEGVLVKTIGDEVMCRFPSAASAITAAIAIQESLRAGLPGASLALQMRMGLHWGPVIFEHGDVFGDAVNVAARMSAIARAGQIITTTETVRALPLALADRTRQVDATLVKGKQETLSIFEVVWEAENLTELVRVTLPALDPVGTILRLEYQGFPLELPSNGSITIGRGENCDVYVNSPLASRLHARIEQRRGKFVFIDQSTNGSFVQTEDGSEVYLKREELILRSHGIISLGEEVEPGSSFLIRYSLGEATVEMRSLSF